MPANTRKGSARALPVVHPTGRQWTARRTVEFLLVAELLDRLSVSAHPGRVMVWFIRPVCALALLMEVLLCAVIVVRGRGELAREFPAIGGVEQLDGRYYLLAFALIPVMIDTMGLLGKQLSHLAHSDAPSRFAPWRGLNISAVQAWMFAIVVPRGVRWAFLWSPMCVVAALNGHAKVTVLAVVVLLMGLVLHTVFVLLDLRHLSRDSHGSPMTTLAVVLRWATALVLGALGGALIVWLVASIRALSSPEADFAAAGLVALVLRPEVTVGVAVVLVSGVLAAGALLVREIRRRSVLVRRPVVVGSRQRAVEGGSALDRGLFPLVGAEWALQKLGSAYSVVAVVMAAAAVVLAVSFRASGASSPAVLPLFDATLVTMIILGSFSVASSAACLQAVGVHHCRRRLRFHVEQRLTSVRVGLGGSGLRQKEPHQREKHQTEPRQRASHQTEPRWVVLRLVGTQWLASALAMAAQCAAVLVIVGAVGTFAHPEAAAVEMLLRALLGMIAVCGGSVVAFHFSSAVVANMRQGTGTATMAHALLHSILALIVIVIFQWNAAASLGLCAALVVWSVSLTVRRIQTAW